MKKITLLLFSLFATSSFLGQTYSTGTIVYTTGFSAKIDVTSTVVTLTLIGPSTDWLALAFDSTQMDDVGKDVVIFDGTNMSDRTFNGQGVVPPLDAAQNWTVSTNTIATGVRTVVATRARNTGDANDYIFSASAQSLNIVWAKRVGSLGIGYHGGGNCGATVANFTLGTEEFNMDSFKLYPNPAKGFTSIELPLFLDSALIKIYDNLGRIVRNETITADKNKINIADLKTGSYLVVIRTDYGNATKTLIVE